MNNHYCDTLDENFASALNLLEGNFSHRDLILMLVSGNIPEKQFAALSLEKLDSVDDANILISNLIGQDGKIREAVSIKIKEFLNNENSRIYFYSLDSDLLADYFIKSIIDINGNICRNILDALEIIKENKNFSDIFIPKLIELIFNLINKINEFDYRDGKYKVNKEVFKLYWCLEALNIFYDKIPVETLKNILKITKDIDEYTIREKTAKILSNNICDELLNKIKKELKNDTNYYVRRY